MSTPRGAVLALRWVGAVGVVLAVLGTSASLATSLAHTDDASTTVEPPGVRVVEVRVDSGRVEVVRAGTGRVEVQREVSGSWSLPSTSTERDGDRLVLRGSCTPELFGGRCRTSYTVTAPADVELVLRSSAGELLVEGGSGPVTATTAAGRVEMTDLRSTVVHASASAGEVSLDFAAAPERVEASTSTGAVQVVVPDDGTTYDVRAISSVGATQVSVPTEVGAARTIDARTSVGAVDVRTSP